MDVFKAQLDRIQQQLGGLSASQKMLTASLVAIMVMTLLWWGRYAGQSEMVPLLPQSFTSSDIAKIQGHLRSIGVPFKVESDKVLVPTDRQDDAIASLAFANLLPDDTVDGFEAISKQMTPWDAATKTDVLIKRGKEITLRQVISRFPGVRDAIVLIEPGAGRRIGAANQATASLSITMDDDGVGDRKLASAAANFVSGAQRGLSPGQVKVVIGGKQYPLNDAPGGSLASTDEMSDQTAASELYLEQKVQGMYPYIQGQVIAKVTVEIDNKTSQLQSKKFDKDNTIQKEKTSDTRTEESSMPTAGASEPGIVPNTGLSIADARPAPAEATKTSEETKTAFENFVGEQIETVSTPAGKVTVVGASVRVPRSHFVEAYKKRFPVPASAQPDPKALDAYVDQELAQMVKEVQGVTHAKDPGAVTVALYDDVMPSMAATAAVPVSTMATTVSGHAKEIALGALAVISLFMVSTMVRKGTPAPVLAATTETKNAPHLSTGNELAGEAGEGDSMLDGMELDEDAVRAQQMLEQVSTMVEENPDAAANIMKRWLNRS